MFELEAIEKKHVTEFKIICITIFYKCIILQVPLSFCSLTSSSCKARWWMNQAEILEVSRWLHPHLISHGLNAFRHLHSNITSRHLRHPACHVSRLEMLFCSFTFWCHLCQNVNYKPPGFTYPPHLCQCSFTFLCLTWGMANISTAWKGTVRELHKILKKKGGNLVVSTKWRATTM